VENFDHFLGDHGRELVIDMMGEYPEKMDGNDGFPLYIYNYLLFVE